MHISAAIPLYELFWPKGLFRGASSTARAAMSDTVEVKAVKSAITAKNSQLIFLGDHEMTPADWSAPWFVI